MNPHATMYRSEVIVDGDGVALQGALHIPEDAHAVVAFAHGSGSSRFSERNRYVADVLNSAGLGTLLFDLLTADEHAIDQETRQLRFDIPLLAARLTAAVDWLDGTAPTEGLAIGLFGASTGAAAALIAAADRPEQVGAVVSRGGRPDLAQQRLADVLAPTLLIVGERDSVVLEMNHQAAAMLKAPHQIQLVPGATHLFEQPGTLERAADHASHWFQRYLRLHKAPPAPARQPN